MQVIPALFKIRGQLVNENEKVGATHRYGKYSEDILLIGTHETNAAQATHVLYATHASVSLKVW